MKKVNHLSTDPAKWNLEIDKYKYACYNIVILAEIFHKHAGAKAFQGRKFKPMSGSTSELLTPDLAFEEPNGKYRAVDEIKGSLPKEKSWWDKTVKQLKAYDVDLDWKGSDLPKHDIMLIVEPKFVQDFLNYMEKSGISISRTFAIIASQVTENDDLILDVKKKYGCISHTVLDKKMAKGFCISLSSMINKINRLRFYDAKPPLIYTMIHIWNDVFSKKIGHNNKKLMRNGIVPLDFTVDFIHKRISKLSHESNQHCVKKSWIKEALDEFVYLKMANRVQDDPNKFQIHYKKHKDIQQVLAERTQKMKKQKKEPSKDGLDKFMSGNENPKMSNHE